MFEKMFVIFDAFKKAQAHIPSVFLLFIGENFWDQFGTIFCMPSSKVKVSWTAWRFKFNTLLII